MVLLVMDCCGTDWESKMTLSKTKSKYLYIYFYVAFLLLNMLFLPSLIRSYLNQLILWTL